MNMDKILKVIDKYKNKYDSDPQWLEIPSTEMPILSKMLQENDKFRLTINGLKIQPHNLPYIFAGGYDNYGSKQYEMI
jgi:hypothetical protein